MMCPRCQGCMVQDQLLDFEGPYGHMWATSSRCLNCGHVHDPVIDANRRSQFVQTVAESTSKLDYLNAELHRGGESVLKSAA